MSSLYLFLWENPLSLSQFMAPVLLSICGSRLQVRTKYISLRPVCWIREGHVTTAKTMRSPLKTFCQKFPEIGNLSSADCLNAEAHIRVNTLWEKNLLRNNSNGQQKRRETDQFILFLFTQVWVELLLLAS